MPPRALSLNSRNFSALIFVLLQYNPAPVSGSETVSMLTDSQSTETDSQDTKGDGDEASTQGSGSSYGNSSTEDSQRNGELL